MAGPGLIASIWTGRMLLNIWKLKRQPGENGKGYGRITILNHRGNLGEGFERDKTFSSKR